MKVGLKLRRSLGVKLDVRGFCGAHSESFVEHADDRNRNRWIYTQDCGGVVFLGRRAHAT